MPDMTVQKPHAARGRGQEALQLQTMTMGALSLDVAVIGGEPWFYAPSLARTLGHKDARDMLQGVPADERGFIQCTPLAFLPPRNLRRKKGAGRQEVFVRPRF